MEMILKIIRAVFVYLLCGVGVLELIRLHDRYSDWMSEDVKKKMKKEIDMDTSDNYIHKEDIEEIKQYLSDIEQTEHCWATREYSDECDCEMCKHKFGCSGSGYEGDDDDWEN